MLPNSNRITARMEERITGSAHLLTVTYPAARPTVTGTSPGPAPVNPLFGTPPIAPHIAPDTAPPAAAPVTMACLWYDAPSSASVQSRQATLDRMGWHADAEAFARVRAVDALTAPGKTVFDACDSVQHEGREYVVLNVVPFSAGFALSTTYTVWLKSARKQ